MAPKLYMIEICPAVRAVLLTAKALGISLDLIRIDLPKGEHLKPEYLNINPQHTVPTLVDDDLILCDSHAIIIYLVEKYAKNDLLYPDDVCQRALINQRLQFNCGVLFARMLAVLRIVIYEKQKDIPSDKIEAVIDTYGFLEKFLEGQKWIVGNNVTLADLALIATATSTDLFVPIDDKKFPNVAAWIRRAEELPYYEANKTGLEVQSTMLKGLLNSN